MKKDKKTIVEMIQRMDANDFDLSSSYIQKMDPVLYQVACHYFKTWEGALKATGLDYLKDLMTRLSPEAKKALSKGKRKRNKSRRDHKKP